MDQLGTMIVIAALLLAVLLAVVFIYRSSNRRMKQRAGQRLGISEYHVLDNTRRLVLVRRDEVEHLLLIGGGQDVVIESRIGSGFYAGAEKPQASLQPPAAPAPVPVLPPLEEAPAPIAAPPVSETARPAAPLRPAPRPSVFGASRPAPLRPADPAFRRPPGSE
jgi:Meckel syndrome type 1 protein